MKLKNRHIFIFIFIAATTIALLIYRDAFFSYFFQDDWFSFRISNAHSLKELFDFFIPRNDVVYYRPLGIQMPFFVMRSLFGLNHFPYRVITFSIHLVNTILIYHLINRLTYKRNEAFMSMALYATSATMYIPMFWFATFAFVLGPTTVFAALLSYIYWLDKNNRKYLLLSFTFFVAGLFIYEIAAVIPLLIVLVSILRKKIQVKPVVAFGLMAVLLFTFRFVAVTPSSDGAYEVSVGRNVLVNIKSFFLWGLNWSEILTEQMQRPFVFNPVINENYPVHAAITVVATLILLTILVVFPAFLYVKVKRSVSLSYITVGMLWFIVGLLPVLPFVGHKFSYYVPVALVGLILCVSIVVNFVNERLKKFNRFYLYYPITIVICWVILSFVTIDLNRLVHWAPRRAQLSQHWIAISKLYNTHAADQVLNVEQSDEVRFALSDQDALQVITDNVSTITNYINDIEGDSSL